MLLQSEMYSKGGALRKYHFKIFPEPWSDCFPFPECNIYCFYCMHFCASACNCIIFERHCKFLIMFAVWHSQAGRQQACRVGKQDRMEILGSTIFEEEEKYKLGSMTQIEFLFHVGSRWDGVTSCWKENRVECVKRKCTHYRNLFWLLGLWKIYKVIAVISLFYNQIKTK